MIHVLEGGLGNQIFQYAEFMHCSNHGSNSDYELDLSWYDINVGVTREVKIFEIVQPRRTISTRRAMKYRDKIHYTLYRLCRKIDEYFSGHRLQKMLHYQPSNTWQNMEKFSTELKNISEVYQNTYGTELVGKVALHLRFGDYVDNDRYAVLNYDELIKKCSQLFPNEIINIYSDDPSAAQNLVECLQLENFSVTRSHDEVQAFIALSKHDVIFCSNSTFSLSAAIIGPCKHIYQPKYWKKNFLFPKIALPMKEITVYDYRK